MLTVEQTDRYQRDGYLLVAGLISPDEISGFMEVESRALPAIEREGLRAHLANPARWRLAAHPAIADIVRQLLGGPPRVVQTMFLDKPSKGGQGIALHQDCHYLPNEPNSLMACWLALTDTDADNGGLCVVPGSHRRGMLPSRANANAEEHAVWEVEHEMRDRDGRSWTHRLYAAQVEGVADEDIVRLSVPAGSGVFFTGMTVHGSYANRSPDRRRAAFATHYVREGTWVFRTDVQETEPVP